ncbi:hypothetical protein [Fluviicola taffensis]|uniref:hypothetical protein n=1 Tax=Fluviicola taffensis TaxID=191579 RepID=UPI003138245D
MNKQSVVDQLKWSIQTLSSEADDQLASFPDFVVVTDELLLEFDNWYRVAIGNYPDIFSDEQLKILKDIDLFIDNLPQEDLSISIADELKTHPFWKELRILAREALQKFGWDSDPPPHDRSTYVRG